ncbi:MAG: hypothetical protein V3V29_02710 [Acidimicrobiia bacterium]
MITTRRTLASALVSVLLVATAVASIWLMASAGVFTGGEQPLPGAPDGDAATAEASTGDPLSIASGFQVSQPRDPFKPLIVTGDTSVTTVPGATTTTVPGATTTTVPGATTTTVPGATTTTTLGDTPAGVRVVLLEVRDESGLLVAVVEVDGETYTVSVGDTFADRFKVVSLTETGGVFTFGDSAFTLSVGQSILK